VPATSGGGEGSTFTVEPRGERALVRIHSVVRAGGLELLLSWLGARLLRPILTDELARLERYAQAHQATGVGPGHGHPPTRASA
jgi:hypothetical protein